MDKNTGNIPNNPQLTTDQIEPLVKVGFDAAKNYPNVDDWTRLPVDDRKHILEKTGYGFGQTGSNR